MSARRAALHRVATFAALGLYGVLQWATLLSAAPVWRLLGLLALVLALTGSVAVLRARHRPAALLCCAVAALAMFPLAGIPLAWVLHVRLALIASEVGHGLSALPGVLVPYLGGDEGIRIVIVLGAGVLLLDAALLCGLQPGGRGDLGRAAAALPLVALAVVPSTLARPQLPYIQGAVLFGLLIAFIWGERIARDRLPAALVLAGLGGVLALVAAPALDPHRPWLKYEALAGARSTADVERFDWSQSYGPLRWPRGGREVLEVRAARPDYWKAENLDVFDGRRWVPERSQPAAPLTGGVRGALRAGGPSGPLAIVARSELARWTQTLHVRIGAMRTPDLIAAGFAAAPTGVPAPPTPGSSPGTWSVDPQLGPGDRYLVRTYSPRPTPTELSAVAAGELASAAKEHPEQLSRYLSIALPAAPRFSSGPSVPRVPSVPSGGAAAQQVASAPFHTARSAVLDSGLMGAVVSSAIANSPYRRAFALARRLARRAPTPYAFVASVKRYLARGFSYDESPPRRAYPLESFLFKDRLGYCQQFAGGMALLLRIGGVPARVATGFTTGAYDPAGHDWRVSDLNAHSWVEAWFPRYGWVRFDPTPALAPARGGAAAAALPGRARPLSIAGRVGGQGRASAPARAARAHPGGPSGSTAIAILLAAAISLTALLALACHLLRRRARSEAGELPPLRRRADPAADELVAELERALARCGAPVGRGGTLAALEQRYHLSSSPEAAAYVRTLALARFAGAGELPTLAQRRALRHQLRGGRGPFGALRALWALPPRISRRVP